MGLEGTAADTSWGWKGMQHEAVVSHLLALVLAPAAGCPTPLPPTLPAQPQGHPSPCPVGVDTVVALSVWRGGGGGGEKQGVCGGGEGRGYFETEDAISCLQLCQLSLKVIQLHVLCGCGWVGGGGGDSILRYALALLTQMRQPGQAQKARHQGDAGDSNHRGAGCSRWGL